MDWLGLLPPLLTIAFALIFRKIILALLIGIISGAILLARKTDSLIHSFGIGFESISNSVSDSDHITVILFSAAIAAMVGIINKSGSMQKLADSISKYARSAKSTQLTTYFLGLLIFFDDYANTLVVGNTMQKLSDKYKVSRAKLAYIVDATAAPVAAIAFITTWIGAEIGYIEQAITKIDLQENAYLLFLSSLKYSFYPILTLIFIPVLIISGKDFGPMLTSKPTLNQSTKKEQKTNAKAYQAIVPVLFLVFSSLGLIMYSGWNTEALANTQNILKKASIIIGESDSYFALKWSSLSALLVAIIFNYQGLWKSFRGILSGVSKIKSALFILIFAWALADIINQLETANYLVSLLSGFDNIEYLSAIVFVFSALIAFATGSSWGTMAIVYPLILPSAWLLSQNTGLDYNLSLQIFSSCIASVLAGSVLGDHCSPISDTTILSSMASGCNHIEHVKTQLPYAITVGIISCICLTISFYITPIMCFTIGIALSFGVIQVLGKKSYSPPKNR